MFRLVGLLLTACLLAPSADAPAFEVASVKPSRPDSRPSSNFPLGPGNVFTPSGGLFNASGLPLVTYLFFAYKVIGNQGQYLLPQLPAWAKSDPFDIQARASGNPGKDDMRMMMRALLADRFKLAVHNETREVPVLAWVLAKPGRLGPNLHQHPDSYPCETNTSSNPAPATLPLGPDGLPALCNGIFGMPPSAPGRQRAAGRNVKLAFIADSLSAGANLGRPMIDKTGLTGTFDFSLEWVPDRQGPPPGAPDTPPDNTGPTLQQALEDQFGIKLQSDKAAMDVIVLDHVEKPSEN